jgi:tetratricopeptide (TPR) repeat protein
MSQDSKPTLTIPSWLILIRDKAVLLVIILAFLLCFTFVLPIPFSRALVKLGNAEVSAGNDSFAETSYNLALMFNADLKEAVDQCIADNNQGQYELAINHCSSAIKIDGNFAVAYFNRGLAYMILKNNDQAIADFSKDIEILPNATRSYINRGSIYMNQQKYDLAIAEFTKSIEVNPKEPQAWLNRGLSYFQQNKADLAISDCSKAIELEEKYWNAYFCLGLAFSNQEKYDLAITNFNKAAEFVPNTRASLLYCMQGITYTKIGNFESAITSLEQGVKLDGTSGNDWCKSALENAHQGIPTP